MDNYFQKLRSYVSEGVKEFSENPVKYAEEAIKDFVKDYWDLGVACFGGYLLSRYDSGLGGLMYFSSLLSPFMFNLEERKNNEIRGARNFLGGFSSIMLGFQHPVTLIIAVSTGIGAVSEERERRREKGRVSENFSNLEKNL